MYFGWVGEMPIQYSTPTHQAVKGSLHPTTQNTQRACPRLWMFVRNPFIQSFLAIWTQLHDWYANYTGWGVLPFLWLFGLPLKPLHLQQKTVWSLTLWVRMRWFIDFKCPQVPSLSSLVPGYSFSARYTVTLIGLLHNQCSSPMVTLTLAVSTL